jgi:NADH-quinone oxidoreductase subunit L
MFVFAMHGLLLSDNLLVIYIFWELVGFCSYLLIGFWRERPMAYRAAKKAFLVNRIGDAGLMMALMAVFFQFNTFNLSWIVPPPGIHVWQWVAGAGILLAVMAKSAQLPLSVWLPDAMTGPTPVSALIHAATMVAAGVYLLIRTIYLFPAVFPIDLVYLSVWIGSVTAFVGGLSAIFQYDIKKILAYSTVSQLGYMIAAVGADRVTASGLDAALFHLQTHAVFKAGLFLGAGAIIHLIHEAGKRDGHHLDAQDIRLMGGFAKQMPWIAAAFLVCSLALMGLPLTSGFLSKEEVLTAVWEFNGGKAPFFLLLASVFTTSFYTVRLLCFVFLGKTRAKALESLPKAEWTIRLPLIVLALGSFFFCFRSMPIDPHMLEHTSHIWISVTSVAFLVAGGLAARLLFKATDLDARFGSGFPKWASGFFGLHTFFQYLGRGLVKLAALIAVLDQRIVDGFINAFAKAIAAFAVVIGWLDRKVVDGAVRLLTALVRAGSMGVKSMHTGQVSLFFILALVSVFTLLWLVI